MKTKVKSNTGKPLSKAERETVITRSAVSDKWLVVTADTSLIKKLTRMYGAPIKLGEFYLKWEIDKNLLSFRKKKKTDD